MQKFYNGETLERDGREVLNELGEATWNDVDDLEKLGIVVFVTTAEPWSGYRVYVNDVTPGRPCENIEAVRAFIAGLSIGITGTCYHEWPKRWLSLEQRLMAAQTFDHFAL